eukprot:TRINITY_DN6247_c0_g1_i20.p1 TRINITY_DN6247_c0_g1~~TRINITY_DN6247_c0_g1_i20.p1  ORF type:complete len:267 (-),score=24.59 TRINITY_DN6247_c0_g1_i20:135-935(-)
MQRRNTSNVLKEISINSLRNAPRLRTSKTQSAKASYSTKENTKLRNDTLKKNALSKPQKTLERKPSKICIKTFYGAERNPKQCSEKIRNSYNSLNRYTSLGSFNNHTSAKEHKTLSGKTLAASKTLCHLLSFDLPTILDTSLDEESVSPAESAKPSTLSGAVKKLKRKRMSIDISREFQMARQNCADARKNKLSVDLSLYNTAGRTSKPKKVLIKPQSKSNSKVINEVNARKHLVRSHLNKLYAKVMLRLKVMKKDKRHIKTKSKF